MWWWSAGAAVTKHHTLVPSTTETHFLSVLGLEVQEKGLGRSSFFWGLQQATSLLSSHTLPFACILIFSSKGNRLDWGPLYELSFYLHHLFKGPISKYRPVLRRWGWRLQYRIWQGRGCSWAHNIKYFHGPFCFESSIISLNFFYYVLDVLLLLIICYNISSNILEEVTYWRWYGLWNQT